MSKQTTREQWQWAHRNPYGRVAQIERLDRWLSEQPEIRAYRMKRSIEEAFTPIDLIETRSEDSPLYMPTHPGNTPERKASGTQRENALSSHPAVLPEGTTAR